MTIKEYVAEQKRRLAAQIAARGGHPRLVIIQANADPASDTYIRGKLSDCQEVGIEATLVKLPVTASEVELLETINRYNLDETVHGLIVQMPLPKHIDENHVKLAVNPLKDVDGFHPLSRLVTCTPKGIVDYLSYLGFDFVGANAVVIGRSNIVGKPLAALLISRHANVTVLHSKTRSEDMDFYLAHADLVCVAVGKKWFLDRQPLKATAFVVDVGINRVEGQLFGDARPGLPVAVQTPVPGGVGLLTRLALITNVWEAYAHEI
ncbi:MAG: bifunctional 5,10-methylenetetrahydrofolate dehydrogenase/5,10-methenyltetrahydrofolate cyclohydrolase [Bacilli bacterium]|jgi:methylenetetrahydrofolate dehydrogenase (NADP+)/methenyltetrahydrofolate cyclohydrolase